MQDSVRAETNLKTPFRKSTFRSSGLGHRKLSGLSSLSGGIRRRLSRYMWKLYDRILELRILERVWFNYLKIFATNVIEILSIINII